MTAFTFAQLTTPPSEEQIRDEMLDYLEANGFVTTNWTSGGVQLSIVMACAHVSALLAQRIADTAKGYLNSTAEGDALKAYSDSHYDNQKIEATMTVGKFVLAYDVDSNAGPYTIDAGDAQVTDGTYNFFNTEQIILNTSNTLPTASFIAEDGGSEFSIAPNSLLRMQGSFAGVTVTNPPISGSSTWITTYGTDEESDDDLKLRNKLKWTTLGRSEVIVDRVRQLALESSPEVKQIYVDDINPRGAGSVDIYLSGYLNTVAAGTLSSSTQYLQSSWFGGTNSAPGGGPRIGVFAAAEVPLNLQATIYYSRNYLSASVRDGVYAALDSFIASSPIGGFDRSPLNAHMIAFNDVVQALESVEGVVTTNIFSLNGGTSDLTLSLSNKLTKPAEGYQSLVMIPLNA